MADFSLNAEITANAKGFKAALSDAQTSLKHFGDKLTSTIINVGNLSFAFQNISKITKPISEFTKDFAKANSAIVKGTGATGQALANLSTSVQNAMKGGVGRTAEEVGEMVADLNTRFGATSKELETLVSDFDKFSNVTGVDTKSSIESLADVMAKWNISADKTNELMDQLVYASQASGLSVDELIGALKSGETTFNAFGMSVTDSIAFLGSLKTQGVDTSAALSALKIGMSNFAQSGEDVETAFGRVVEQIKNAESNTAALNIAVSKFGSKGGAELVKVFKENNIDNFTTALKNAQGALAETEEASRTSADAMKDLKAQIQATFFTGETDSYIKQIIDSIKIGFTEIDSEAMYEIFNKIYHAVQIMVNSVNALIQGDWETVWDYAKLGVLKFADSALDIISKLLDNFKDDINKFIEEVVNPFIEKLNWALEKLGKDTIDSVGLIENFDLSGLTGIPAQIEKIEQDIIRRTNKNGQTLLKDLKKTTSEIKQEAKNAGDDFSDVFDNSETEKSLNKTTKSTNKFFTGLSKGFKNLGKTYEGITEKTEAFGKVAQEVGKQTASIMASSFGTMFNQLGKDLVSGEASFQDYGASAVESIAQVLQALGSELLALSAVRAAHYDYGTAAAAAAGATAAFVASGVLTGVSQAMKTTADETDAAVESMDGWQSSIASLHDTITDLVESAVEFNGFITAVTQANDMIDAATSNYEKAVKQLENFAAELEILEGVIEIQNFSLFGGGDNWWDKLSHLQQQYLIIQQKRLQDQIKSTAKEIEEAERIIDDAIDTITDSVYEQNEELKEQEELLKSIYSGEWLDVGKVITKQQQLLHLNESLVSTLAEFTNLGASIGDTLLDSLNDSLGSSDFLSSVKKTIRTNLLKIAVYTDEMRGKLAKVGTKLAEALSGQTSLKEVRNELTAIWEEASKSAKEAEKIIEEAFGDIADSASDATESLEDSLTSFEKAMESFKETIADTGGSIASEIANGLSNGLDQSNFLDNMKTWLRNNLIQMVVYTDSMKGEIEAISAKIAEVMGSGRMFTSDELNEIRRDLSFAYESATTRMGTIDEILNSVFSGYATGTQNATAGLHLVGEAGPELVRFNGGEQVFNAGETREMLSSGMGGNNFNITFNNMQDTSAFSMMQQLKQYQRELAINGII